MPVKPFVEMASESFARAQKIVRKIKESKTPRRSWHSLMSSFRGKLGFTNEGLTLCGWPIDFVVGTSESKQRSRLREQDYEDLIDYLPPEDQEFVRGLRTGTFDPRAIMQVLELIVDVAEGNTDNEDLILANEVLTALKRKWGLSEGKRRSRLREQDEVPSRGVDWNAIANFVINAVEVWGEQESGPIGMAEPEEVRLWDTAIANSDELRRRISGGFGESRRRSVRERKSKVGASSLLTCMILGEAYRAIELGKASKVATPKGVVEASKLIKEASLLEGVQNWKEWLSLLFPHVDPTYVEFMSQQGAKK